MSFETLLIEKATAADNIIKDYLPDVSGEQSIIMDAMHYAIEAGGKRLRPILMYETYKLFGGDKSEVIKPFMAAIEMIHTYSLVHDDLPAMDNDDLRRGKPTTHKVYGEAMGILAGDALLNYAFETMLKSYQNLHFSDDVKDIYYNIMRAMQILGVKSGIYGMLGGQVSDVQNTGLFPGKIELDDMYEKKTAALLEASMMIGAVLAGANVEEIKEVREIASNLGMAFQVRDDILDVTSDEATLGKPIGSDAKNEKTTYVTLFGLEEAKRWAKTYSDKALSGLKRLSGDTTFLEELFEYLIERNY
ncbi:MAG: polyprenyl synthetase family protein [Lachnospiraceae bacterium]|jgi:geranylgeranyl diphosphate synthase type II|nr:polyprenyl synthetase family protein [Lachnospiraceae bacterium]